MNPFGVVFEIPALVLAVCGGLYFNMPWYLALPLAVVCQWINNIEMTLRKY